MDAIQRILDEREITRLKYVYCRFADLLDPVGQVSVFTDDCRVNLDGSSSSEVHGKAAVEALMASRAAVVAASSHHISNIEFNFLTDEEASVHSYLYSWQRFKGYPEIRDRHRWARYHDTFLRLGGTWKQSVLGYLVVGEYAEGDKLRFGETMTGPIWQGPTGSERQ